MSESRGEIKARHSAIQTRERRQARALAFAVFETKPFSVWEVLFVPILVINHMNQRRLRDLFVDNFLYTKLLAARGALDLAQGDRSRDEVFERIDGDTRRVLKETPSDLYTDEIRQAQLAEIELLLAHDVALLATQGKDYDALVRSAYRDRREYDLFLRRLQEREQEVSDLSVRTLGARGDATIADKLAAATVRTRATEADRIFAPSAGLVP